MTLLEQYKMFIDEDLERVKALRQEMYELPVNSQDWQAVRREISAIMDDVRLAQERVKELA